MNQRAASADRRHPARFWLAALASAHFGKG